MKLLKLRCIVSLLLLSLAFIACKKSQSIQKTAERTGIINLDVLYTCGGCAGSAYDIVFQNDSIPYHIGNDLTPFGVTTSANFPLNVTVTSKPDNAVATNFVIITTLKINK